MTLTPPPDLILVIRGGCFVNDQDYLKDYNLAALLSKRLVPIWGGIVHEKNQTKFVEVSNLSFDTSSKVIVEIINLIHDRVQEELDSLQMK